jgi:hypothetical protein
MGKKAIVKEIQVGGYEVAHSLEVACGKYLDMLYSGRPYRSKMIFVIELPNGETKQITIRDEDDEMVAYGDFEGLPDFLEYAKIVEEEDSAIRES